MKLLYVHDHYFMTHRSGAVYSASGSFPAAIWARYLSAFASITVVGRDGGQCDDTPSSRVLSSAQRVDFCLMQNMSTFNALVGVNKAIRAQIAELVRTHHAIILRLPSRYGELVAREARRQNRSYAVEMVGCAFESYYNYGTLLGKLVAPFAYLSTRYFTVRAEAVLYVTQFFLQQRYPTKAQMTTFCSNVELDAVDAAVLQTRLARIAAARGVPIAIGLIGHFMADYKGVDTAIRMLATLRVAGCNCELHIVGRGEPAPYLALAKQLAVAEYTHFLGVLPGAKAIAPWLDSMDYYIQPSRIEGLPRALVEAMSRGLPAVASRVGGIPELLKRDYLAAKEDVAGLSERLLVLMRDSKATAQAAQDNFIHAQSYEKSRLDKRRTAFWQAYAASLKQGGS